MRLAIPWAVLALIFVTDARAQPVAGTVTGVIKVGSANLADGKVVTCIDANAPHPTSQVPSDGQAGSGKYQCDGVENGGYLLSVDGTQANPSGTCADVNDNTVTCNATVGGTCGNPAVTFTAAMLPGTLATCRLMGRRGRRRRAPRSLPARSRTLGRPVGPIGLLLFVLVGFSSTTAQAQLCTGKPYETTLNAYVEAWKAGDQNSINALNNLLAPNFQRFHGALQSTQHVGGESALARVGGTIRYLRTLANVSAGQISVSEVACNLPNGNTATAVLGWKLKNSSTKAGRSTLTFNLATNPVQLTREDVSQ